MANSIALAQRYSPVLDEVYKKYFAYMEDFISNKTERGVREHVVRFEWSAPMNFGQLLEYLGRIPIPPYLNRATEEVDLERYQTLYARYRGSVAAPTAGLHFTDELLEKIRSKGIKTAFVTLHVGLGTFRPVKAEEISEHHMHSELYVVEPDQAAIINETKAAGGRIIAVGTTSSRTLE